MRHITIFHPEWGCLSPAPSFMRTLRTAAVATAIGVAVGGGAVLSLTAHPDQTSVAQRTLARPFPAVPAAINVPLSNSEKVTSSAQSEEILLSESQPNALRRSELTASSAAVVTAPAKVRVAAEAGSAKTAVVPTAPMRTRPKHLSQEQRHKDLVSPARPPQRSLVSRSDSNVFQGLLARLTAVIGHVWPSSTSPTSRTSRIHGGPSAAAA
jgi:hypothetical protein